MRYVGSQQTQPKLACIKEGANMRAANFIAILTLALSLAASSLSHADESTPTKNPLRISVSMEGEGLETSVEIEVKNAGKSKILVDKYLVHGFTLNFDDELGQIKFWHTLSSSKGDEKAPPDKTLIDKASLEMSKERFIYLEPGASLTRKMFPYKAYAAGRTLPWRVYEGKVIWKQGAIADRLLLSDAQLTKCYVRYVGIPDGIPFEPFPEDLKWDDAPKQEFVVTFERHIPHRSSTKVSYLEKETSDSGREEVAKKFYHRASKEEIAEFEAFIKNKDPKKEPRILELLLGKLTHDELFNLGVTAVVQAGREEWCVAWSDDSPKTVDAVTKSLGKIGIEPGGSFSRGRGGWHIEKADFFKAQAALQASAEVRACGVTIVKPKLSLR